MRSYTMNAIFKRDNWQCQHCKCFANDYRSLHIPSGHKLYLMKDSVKKFLTVDHIIPLSNGGTSDRSNLQTLCNNCNRDKDSKHENAFLLRRKDFVCLGNYGLPSPLYTQGLETAWFEILDKGTKK